MKATVAIIAIFIISSFAVAKPPPCDSYGDLNDDGDIDSADSLILTWYINGVHNLTEEQLRRADVSGDGIVDVADLQVIMQFIHNVTDTFPVCGGGGSPPIADAGGPYTGIVGEPITFDASNSYDPDGYITSYIWDINNDGIPDLYGGVVNTTFNSIGNYTVRLTVVDNDGFSSYDNATVVITESVAPKYAIHTKIVPYNAGEIILSPPGGIYNAGAVVTLIANANDGYTFDHWEGDITGNVNPTVITINSNKNITAVFLREGGGVPMWLLGGLATVIIVAVAVAVKKWKT